MSLILNFLAAAMATVSFSLIFGVPRNYYPLCGLIGAAGWTVDVWLGGHGLGPTESVFCSTVFVILLSRLAAVRCRCPVTVFLIAGIIPLVPGARIYWCAYYFVTNQVEYAAENGFLALKVAVAIVLGILLVFEIPQKWFRVGMRKR